MRLVPVLELSAESFQKESRSCPDGSFKELPNEWGRYWKESLAEKEIVDLPLHEHGYGFVSLSDIMTSQSLQKILLTEFEDHEFENDSVDVEQFSSLQGGYFLELENGVAIAPECCGALIDISEWKMASQLICFEEVELWIGHPWLMVSAINEKQINIRRTAEYGEPEEPVNIVMNKYELQQAIVKADKILDQFQGELSAVLQSVLPVKMSSNELNALSKILVYGH